MTTIPVIVCAKNEQRALGATLESLVAACAHAEARSVFRYDVRVVLDDTTDGTATVARRHARVTLLESHGGKVEAQRTGLGAGTGVPPFAIFCDADVRPSEDALLALTELLDTRPEVHVAMCPLRPLAPRRRTPLAAALHTYNLRRGFSSSRTWFNGKLFAMRAWNVPTRASLAVRIAALPTDPFYDFSAGIVVDDIFLSRAVVHAHGPAALAETPSGVVLFRAPETWRGMHRYYRRMRREIERLDVLFPETAQAHRQYGRRTADLLARAPWRERVHHALFRAALVACKAAYVAERAFVRHVRRSPRDPWPAIEETKVW
jgi:cellulose synthase/poly-beta-1,6-N-acetylglucosamine synthase-like glycosyltransferase